MERFSGDPLVWQHAWGLINILQMLKQTPTEDLKQLDELTEDF